MWFLNRGKKCCTKKAFRWTGHSCWGFTNQWVHPFGPHAIQGPIRWQVGGTRMYFLTSILNTLKEFTHFSWLLTSIQLPSTLMSLSLCWISVDYLLFIVRDVALHPNPDEVADVMYVNREQLKELLRKADAGEEGVKLSPWFRLVVDNFLLKWWKHVELGTLQEAADMTTIHKLI